MSTLNKKTDDNNNNNNNNNHFSNTQIMRLFSFIWAHDIWTMITLAQLRNFPLDCIILITDVFKETNFEVNCNLQPDECTVRAVTKYERSTMCLVHSSRCRLELTHGENVPLQLLRCTSGQADGSRLSSCFLWTFAHRGRIINLSPGLVAMYMESRERLHFR